VGRSSGFRSGWPGGSCLGRSDVARATPLRLQLEKPRIITGLLGEIAGEKELLAADEGFERPSSAWRKSLVDNSVQCAVSTCEARWNGVRVLEVRKARVGVLGSGSKHVIRSLKDFASGLTG
jgi:hypothetical protein